LEPLGHNEHSVNGISTFRLTKWYLDVTTEAGEAWIGYAGHVRLGPLRLAHASCLRVAGDDRSEAAIWSRARMPRIEERRIAWEEPRLAVRGSWRATVPGAERELWRNGTAAVRWQCLAPAAAAEVSGPSYSLAGLGYAERLDLDVAPWRLPIAELRWGRFLAPDKSLVWIQWRGAHPLRLALRDGSEVTLRDCNERELVFGDGGRLHLDPVDTIREGTLGDTVLARYRVLRRLVPRRWRDLHEHKFISRGVLHENNGRTISGWAIHEVVRWP